MATGTRSRRGGRVGWMLAAPLALSALALACSEPARNRVLHFFFDGVDQPVEDRRKGYAPMGRAASGALGRTMAERAKPEQLMVIHAPYRDNQCNACHNINTGLLFKTPQQGLCRNCHSDVPGEARFVHGPVALGECLYCHHPHGSAYPHLLLAEPAQLCFRCHRQEDLGPGSYHSALATQSCSECHDAHGGGDRFFLRKLTESTPFPDSTVEPVPASGPAIAVPVELQGPDLEAEPLPSAPPVAGLPEAIPLEEYGQEGS